MEQLSESGDRCVKFSPLLIVENDKTGVLVTPQAELVLYLQIRLQAVELTVIKSRQVQTDSDILFFEKRVNIFSDFQYFRSGERLIEKAVQFIFKEQLRLLGHQ